MFRYARQRLLRRGSRGEEVRQLQQLLQLNGFDPGPIDGIYGQRTEKAVKSFQEAKQLEPDGVVGPQTWQALTEIATDTGARNGRSLHLGLNTVDDAAYGVPIPPLRGCENDARSMQELARAQGFSTSLMLNEQCTSTNVADAVRSAAGQLKAGDFFLLTYAGHGSQVPDETSEEKDGLDETWVLHDRQLIDDELYALWGEFDAGVRILVVSDSCHSGSVTRLLRLPYQALAGAYQDSPDRGFVLDTSIGVPRWASDDVAGWTRLRDSVREVMPQVIGQLQGKTSTAPVSVEVDSYVDAVLSQLPEAGSSEVALDPDARTRDLPLAEATRDFHARVDMYRDVKASVRQARPPSASVLLLAAAQDEQLALDGRRNGLFTQCLLETWNSGQFDGTGYEEFHRRIVKRLTAPQQTPNLFWATPVDPRFAQQRPFTI